MKRCSAHAAEKYLPRPERAATAALCLSGSGFRAILFHVGALRRLNELGWLSRFHTVSAVATGNITAGLLLKHWEQLKENEQGSFTNFEKLIARPLEQFTKETLSRGPSFWQRFFGSASSATERFIQQLDRRLYRGVLLQQLPTAPQFLFTATNLQTAGYWTFSPNRCGEILLGFTEKLKVKLAEVVTASLADPIHFPAFRLKLDPKHLQEGVLGPKADAARRSIALVSGALYDPLGVEPVWRTHPFVLSIDAGDQAAPIELGYRDSGLNRFMRSHIVQRDQDWEARKRWLMLSYLNGLFQGAYISLSAYHGHYGSPHSKGYPAEIVEMVRRLPTDYHGITPDIGKVLINHGYTMTDTAIRSYLVEADNEETLRLPYPDSVDRNQVLLAIEPKVMPVAEAA